MSTYHALGERGFGLMAIWVCNVELQAINRESIIISFFGLPGFGHIYFKRFKFRQHPGGDPLTPMG